MDLCLLRRPLSRWGSVAETRFEERSWNRPEGPLFRVVAVGVAESFHSAGGVL